jgi:methanogenic corrinoid protein MtbC1
LKEIEIATKLDQISESIAAYDGETATTFVLELLHDKVEPKRILVDGLSKGMAIVSDKFNRLELFLPHLIMASDAMQLATSKMIEALPNNEKENFILGKVVIGTVRGDIHDLGKNIYKTMLAASGFEIYDLGVDVPAEAFINRAEEIRADIIALSCLMTTGLVQLREVSEDLERLKIRKKYKLLVGGGAVNPEWSNKIGADGYALEATDGVDIAKKILGRI